MKCNTSALLQTLIPEIEVPQSSINRSHPQRKTKIKKNRINLSKSSDQAV